MQAQATNNLSFSGYLTTVQQEVKSGQILTGFYHKTPIKTDELIINGIKETIGEIPKKFEALSMTDFTKLGEHLKEAMKVIDPGFKLHIPTPKDGGVIMLQNMGDGFKIFYRNQENPHVRTDIDLYM